MLSKNLPYRPSTFPFLEVTSTAANTSSNVHGAQVASSVNITKVVGVVGEGFGKSQSNQGATSSGTSNNVSQPA